MTIRNIHAGCTKDELKIPGLHDPAMVRKCVRGLRAEIDGEAFRSFFNYSAVENWQQISPRLDSKELSDE